MKRKWTAARRYWVLYLLLIPVLAYYFVYRYYPMLLQFILSFEKFRLNGGIFHSPWVGFGNFADLFSKADFYTVLRNTIIISLQRIVFGFFPPIILAILLFDIRSSAYRKVSQTFLYIPHFFSWVIIYSITFAMLSQSGFLNQLIKMATGDTVNFLVKREYFRTILVGSAVWKDLGWGTILYLAALTSLDPSLYEAARIDGAGPIQRIRHITIPGIAPVIVFLFTLSIGGILYAGGEQVLLYYNPATYQVGDIIDTWVYRQGLGQLQYSLAAAMSLFQSLFGLVLLLLANHFSKKYADIGIW